MNLIIVNYSMDEQNPVFAHQKKTVEALSPFFTSITVFTNEKSNTPLPTNVQVYIVPWSKSSKIANIYRILANVIPYLYRNQSSIVFCHMTDLQSALISPFTLLFRMKHVLWYAHRHNSAYLIFASFFVSKIVSSTVGSCRLGINRKKITYINQGIEEQDFTFIKRAQPSTEKILYFGRLDKSKNIHIFFELFKALEKSHPKLNIDLYGVTTNLKSKLYIDGLRNEYNDLLKEGSVNFMGPISRNNISLVSRRYDLFVNLFFGSLDKALIEATMLGLPVVTWNEEYCNQFGTWSNKKPIQTLDFILEEIRGIKLLKNAQFQSELNRRLELAVKLHGFQGWTLRMIENLIQ